MNNPLQHSVQAQAYQIVYWQLGAVIIFSVIAGMISGIRPGLSALGGGLAYSLPNLVFVWRVFRYVGAQQMSQFVTAFFLGEFLKLGCSAIIVLMLVKYLAVTVSSVLIGFIAAIISFWLACGFHLLKASKKQVN